MLSDVVQPVIKCWSLLDNDVVNVVYSTCDTCGRTIDYIRVDPSNSATSVVATLGYRNVVIYYIRVDPSNITTSVAQHLGIGMSRTSTNPRRLPANTGNRWVNPSSAFRTSFAAWKLLPWLTTPPTNTNTRLYTRNTVALLLFDPRNDIVGHQNICRP